MCPGDGVVERDDATLEASWPWFGTFHSQLNNFGGVGEWGEQSGIVYVKFYATRAIARSFNRGRHSHGQAQGDEHPHHKSCSRHNHHQNHPFFNKVLTASGTLHNLDCFYSNLAAQVMTNLHTSINLEDLLSMGDPSTSPFNSTFLYFKLNRSRTAEAKANIVRESEKPGDVFEYRPTNND